MKYKILYPILLLAGCFMMSACTDDENGGDDTPPAGALPSEEFVLSTLPDEPYAEDAIRIENTAENVYEYPFYSLELMGDGYYLLTKNPTYNTYASEAGQAKGKGALRKNRTAVQTRGTRDENGTIEMPDGSVYGPFTKLGDKKYRLSDGSEIDLQKASGSNGSVVYKEANGETSTVYVKVSEPIATDATKNICRTWECNELELWLYYNGSYIAHSKQVYNNGTVNSSYKTVSGGPTKDEFFNDFGNTDDEYCYKVVFTNVGTYLCYYLDEFGVPQVSYWKWEDEGQGTLYWYDEYDDGHCTVRFAGNQMRIYEDYSVNEDGESIRLIGVNTLTAKAQ